MRARMNEPTREPPKHIRIRERRLRLRAGAPRGEARARPRRVRFGRRPLRPDERPDVGRAAPALEAVHAGADRSAAGPAARSTSPAAPAISPPGMARQVGATGLVVLTDINARDARASAATACSIEASLAQSSRSCMANAEWLPFRDASFDCVTIGFGLRNVTDKAARSLDAPRAEAGRPAAGARVLAARGRCAEAAVRRLLVQRAAAARAASSRATRRATAISPSRSAASRTRKRCTA